MTNPTPAPVVPDPPRWGLMRRLLGPLIILASLITAIALLGFVRWARTPAREAGPAIVVDIPKGEGLSAIARALRKEGVVDSRRLFIALAVLSGAQNNLRAGEYEFAAGLSPWEVLGILRRGRTMRHYVTLQEGWTVAQMADAIAAAGLAERGELLALAGDADFAAAAGVDASSLEGYCFPDTYAFARGMTPGEILRRLVDRFEEVYAEEREALAADPPPGLGRHEIVTLASIVEKETGVAGERPLIASVFLNRLRRGMLLQSDPTVIYGIPDFDGNLTREHLATPSPYNTYLRPGLPPGPIANPGREALRAVLRPEPSAYLYFVSRNDGSHEFSKTLAEHNRAVHRYQRSPASRRNHSPAPPGG